MGIQLGEKLRSEKSRLAFKFRGSEKIYRNKAKGSKGIIWMWEEGLEFLFIDDGSLMIILWRVEKMFISIVVVVCRKMGLVPFSFATYSMSCSELVKNDKSIRCRKVVFLCSEPGNHATPTHIVLTH